MRVLVVENYHNTPLGLVGRALDEAGAIRKHCKPYAGDELPAGSDGYDALILLGGGQNALDDGNHPWFPATLELIRSFGDRAVLGICLGAQLVARAYGGTNRVGGHYEFGWHQVQQTPEAGDDPVFAGSPPSFRIFQWHDDHFTLPPGATRLAASPVAANQAFRIGRATYAMQFHFEADRAQVVHWSAVFADLISTREADWPGRQIVQAQQYGPTADAVGLALARKWVAAVGA